MPDWFETMEDRFWLRPDEAGGEEVWFILSALCLRRGDAVLDAPCRAGRVSLHLARAGCVVTGVDLRDTFPPGAPEVPGGRDARDLPHGRSAEYGYRPDCCENML